MAGNGLQALMPTARVKHAAAFPPLLPVPFMPNTAPLARRKAIDTVNGLVSETFNVVLDALFPGHCLHL